MRIYPAVHYTMGGLWVDYNLMSTIPGLYVIGEANFSDHGANRLGASALMQGLADGYFVLPHTIGDYLASAKPSDDRAAITRRCRQVEAGDGGPHPAAAVDQRQADGGLVPPRAGQDHVGLVRHGPQRDRPSGGARADPRAPRGVLAQRQRPRQRRGAEPGAGEGRPGGRLPGARRADVPATRCTARNRAADISARSTRPRTARRCGTTSTSPTWPPGSTRDPRRPERLHKEPLEFEYVHLAQRSYK